MAGLTPGQEQERMQARQVPEGGPLDQALPSSSRAMHGNGQGGLETRVNDVKKAGQQLPLNAPGNFGVLKLQK